MWLRDILRRNSASALPRTSASASRAGAWRARHAPTPACAASAWPWRPPPRRRSHRGHPYRPSATQLPPAVTQRAGPAAPKLSSQPLPQLNGTAVWRVGPSAGGRCRGMAQPTLFETMQSVNGARRGVVGAPCARRTRADSRTRKCRLVSKWRCGGLADTCPSAAFSRTQSHVSVSCQRDEGWSGEHRRLTNAATCDAFIRHVTPRHPLALVVLRSC